MRAHRFAATAIVMMLTVAFIAVTLGSASASAAVGDRERSARSYDEVRWDCGYPMRVVGVESHMVKVRADKKLDGNSFVSDNYDLKEAWTAADGRSFTLAAHGIAKDVNSKSVGGSVYEFTFHNSGQPLTITDSSGAVVARARGNVSFRYTIDFANGEFNIVDVRVSGPHPLFGVDLCKAVAPLVGGDSAQYLTPRPIGSTSFDMGYYEYLPPSYSNAGSNSPLLAPSTATERLATGPLTDSISSCSPVFRGSSMSADGRLTGHLLCLHFSTSRSLLALTSRPAALPT